MGHPISGIAPLVIGSICTLCFVTVLLYFTSIRGSVAYDYSRPEEVAVLKALINLSIAFLCNLALALVGLALGVAGLIRSRRTQSSRLFPLLGIGLNGLILLTVGAIIAVASVSSVE